MGAANQFRAIGSTIIVAVTTALFNGFVFPRLSEIGITTSDRVIETFSHSATAKMSPEVWDEARRILSQGYNRQMLVLVGCGAAQAVVALLQWEKQDKTKPSEEPSMS